MFADSARIFIKSGKGGDGHVSFRREKFVAAGGPDGGDGGKGGDVIFEVDTGQNTLNDFRHCRKYVAGNGGDGEKRRRHGADGEDVVLKVPEGTIVKDAETGKIIVDMSGDNRRVIVLHGGKGGLGNMHFATSTMQVPQYAQPGKPSQELEVILELKVIADIGLVGFPNVGKSTLLARVSNARPEIANYHFTTLSPHLGVVDLGEGEGFVMADIPGIIEGAAEGAGLGLDFLKHIERTRVLIHVVDAAGTEGRDPVEDVKAILNELRKYSGDLVKKPQLIAANKIDAIVPEDNAEDPIQRLKDAFEPEGMEIFPISAVTGQGVKDLLWRADAILKTMPREPVVYESDYEFMPQVEDLPYTVVRDDKGVYVVEGPKIEKMLGYTNLDSEKGFRFFQKFLRTAGILDKLEEMGIREGDTVRMYGHEFDYYKE